MSGVIAVIFMLLGGLWFLQGIDVVRIKPMACIANCQEITGGSLFWAIVGLLLFILGVFMGYKSAVWIRLRKNK